MAQLRLKVSKKRKALCHKSTLMSFEKRRTLMKTLIRCSLTLINIEDSSTSTYSKKSIRK